QRSYLKMRRAALASLILATTLTLPALADQSPKYWAGMTVRQAQKAHGKPFLFYGSYDLSPTKFWYALLDNYCMEVETIQPLKRIGQKRMQRYSNDPQLVNVKIIVAYQFNPTDRTIEC